MKKCITRLFTLTALLAALSCTGVHAATWTETFEDGEGSYGVTDDFIIVNNRAMVTLRDFATNFNDGDLDIYWDADSKTAVISEGEYRTVFITANQNFITILDNETERTIELDQPAQIIDGHFRLPLRQIGELYSLGFEWDADRKLVLIYS